MILTLLCFAGAIISILNGEYIAFGVLLLDTLAAFLFYKYKLKNKTHKARRYNKAKTVSHLIINNEVNKPQSYFAGCISEEQIKYRYKELCKALHPDVNNGDDEEFIQMLLEYEELTDVAG